MPSFDVVSEVNLMEVENAFNQARKEIQQRYDFKGTSTDLERTAEGGILVTCSCSGKLTADRFADLLGSVFADVKRPVQVLERRGAGRDHPVLAGVPETGYLKCWIHRIL